MNSAASQKLDPIVGSLFARRFLVDRLFAYGGMGTVYHASDTRTGRAIALKVLRAEYNSDPITVERFLREAKMVGCIKNPHVVELVDSGMTDDGFHYIATEFLVGKPLDVMLQECKYVQPDKAVDYAIQAAEGLIASHSFGITHRDLKPANLFIVQTPNTADFLKIIDYGIARRSGDKETDEAPKLTSFGMTLGTPYYMSPEQVRGEVVDGRADIYSLGIILWECLYGSTPFTGQTMDVFRMHIEEKLPKLPSKFMVVPLYVEAYKVLTKALAKNRNRRYQTMQEFQRALSGVLERCSGNEKGSHLSPKKKGSAPTSNSIPAYRSFFESNAILKIAIISVAAIVVLVLGIFLISNALSTEEDIQEASEVVSAEGLNRYHFQSTPSGADVFINEHRIGITPVRLELEESLPFEVTFKHKDYSDFHVTMMDTMGVGSKAVLGAHVDFGESREKKGKKRSGKSSEREILIETLPSGANLHIDGEVISSRTPYSHSIGESVIRTDVLVEKEGYQSEFVTVYSLGDSVEFHLELVKAKRAN